MDIECCVQHIKEIIVADNFKVKRVELCAALEVGGLTPSIGMVSQCVNVVNQVEIHPIIRPRSGDFEYDDLTLAIMKKDIKAFSKEGVKGVSLGVLDARHEIDITKNKALIDVAKSEGLEVCFHRAFDMIPNQMEALETLISLGVDRVLTSGQKATAEQGLYNITALAKQSKKKMQIMAGGGICPNNVLMFSSKGISAIHFSIHDKVTGDNSFGFGDNYKIDFKKIENILKQIYQS